MRRTHFIFFIRCFAGLASALALTTLVFPLSAQPVSNAHPYYDVSREITLTGTVSSVLTKPSKGMIIGTHLLLLTSSGTVDASLGRFAMSGNQPFLVTPGQQIEVTGITKTLNHRQVLIVRLAKSNGETYTVRDQRGLAIRSRTRAHAATKGESR